MYFTIENKDTKTIEISIQAGLYVDSSYQGPITTDMSYSYDLNVWTQWDNIDSSINLQQGEKVYLKGDNLNNLYERYDSDGDYYVSDVYRRLKTNGQFECYGNIMSLLYKDNFKNQFVLPDGT